MLSLIGDHQSQAKAAGGQSKVRNVTARILVVEDDKPVAAFLRKGLEAEKYTVEVAAAARKPSCSPPNPPTT